MGPYCLLFREKTGLWEVWWPREGLLSFIVDKIQAICLWEGLREKVQNSQYRINKYILL